jgi:hypothetical protein
MGKVTKALRRSMAGCRSSYAGKSRINRENNSYNCHNKNIKEYFRRPV